MRSTWTVLIGIALVCGCSVIELSPTSLKVSPTERVAEIRQFQSSRSIADVDRKLHELLAAPDAQAQAERLIEGWGKHGSWYDLAVVKLWLERWPQEEKDGKQRFDHHRLFDAAQRSLTSHPSTACQVFWYYQWTNGVRDFAAMMDYLEPRWVCDYNSDSWVDYRMILICAGIASGLPLEWEAGESARRANFDRLRQDWWEQKLLVLSQRPFLRYDDELGRWVVDQEAKKANRYLTPDEQRASERPAPLPDWDSEIVPPRPVRVELEDEQEELLGIPTE